MDLARRLLVIRGVVLVTALNAKQMRW